MLLSDYELIIIKKKELGDDEVNNLKSDMGNYVGYRTDNENWVVVDRAPYKVEETFWVYGYHPRLQRKTYQWILDNFIIPNGKDKTIFKTVQVYNNKLLIESNGDFERAFHMGVATGSASAFSCVAAFRAASAAFFSSVFCGV